MNELPAVIHKKGWYYFQSVLVLIRTMVEAGNYYVDWFFAKVCL